MEFGTHEQHDDQCRATSLTNSKSNSMYEQRLPSSSQNIMGSYGSDTFESNPNDLMSHNDYYFGYNTDNNSVTSTYLTHNTNNLMHPTSISNSYTTYNVPNAYNYNDHNTQSNHNIGNIRNIGNSYNSNCNNDNRVVSFKNRHNNYRNRNKNMKYYRNNKNNKYFQNSRNSRNKRNSQNTKKNNGNRNTDSDIKSDKKSNNVINNDNGVQVQVQVQVKDKELLKIGDIVKLRDSHEAIGIIRSIWSRKSSVLIELENGIWFRKCFGKVKKLSNDEINQIETERNEKIRFKCDPTLISNFTRNSNCYNKDKNIFNFDYLNDNRPIDNLIKIKTRNDPRMIFYDYIREKYNKNGKYIHLLDFLTYYTMELDGNEVLMKYASDIRNYLNDFFCYLSQNSGYLTVGDLERAMNRDADIIGCIIDWYEKNVIHKNIQNICQ